MRKSSVLGATIGALVLSHSASAAVPAPAKPVQALLPIADAKGEWKIHKLTARMTLRGMKLRYDMKVDPLLSMPMLSLSCSWPQTLLVEVTGMVPAQAFPQPEMVLTTGAVTIDNFTNATFVPASPASVTKLPPNVEGGLANMTELVWPGFPAHAKLSMEYKNGSHFMEALQQGQPIAVRFSEQQRRYPAVPAEKARKFVDTCRSLEQVLPPRPSDLTGKHEYKTSTSDGQG